MKEEKLLGIHIDGNLNFDQYVNQLLKKQNQKQFLEFANTWMLGNTGLSSKLLLYRNFHIVLQIKCSTAENMEHSLHEINPRASPQTQDVNRTYIRCTSYVRSICVLCVRGCNQCIKNPHDLTFEELLQKMCILINVQILAIEIFKSKKMNIN